ncbi:Lipase precursor [Anaerotruncus sp. 2789STDY5834896]|uniref:Lipase n=1 Tax=uncultured Anaerotruncus sp. TaxID=905011 RepID=A0A1C6JZT1_9FIRM|nr:Lipase precursor [uncultured Anaerotruncus sp.]
MLAAKRALAAAGLLSLINTPLWVGLAGGPLWLHIAFTALLTALYLALHIRPRRLPEGGRLQVMMGGRELLVLSCPVLLVQPVLLVSACTRWKHLFSLGRRIGAIALSLLLVAALLTNGFLRLMFTCQRLRILWRVLLLLCWWVPVVGPLLLIKACSLAQAEYRFEAARAQLQVLRRDSQVCATRYPLLLVHGIFFRDWQLVNYWGRIPKALIQNGATIFYGQQQSAASVARSAAELARQIERVVAATGCEKVNIIAHSKGGLDARYAISCLGLAPQVASLTTINTPHRGCVFAQVLLKKLPGGLVRFIATRYNKLFAKLGDDDPDFMAGVQDLTARRCAQLAQQMPASDGILYQSAMSVMKRPGSAAPPLNLSYRLVKKYDRAENDGLVALPSARYGKFLGCLRAGGKRGISHGDMIDLMREDIPGFDVREFYIGLVRDLKARGL